MSAQPLPFFLIVTDHDREFFCVEGPMTEDRWWQEGARAARNRGRKIVCGPAGADRDVLVTEFLRVEKLAGVPPGSILRAHR
jgi:hypothetical protein